MKFNTSPMNAVLVAVAGTMLIVMAASPSAQRRRGGPGPNTGAPIATNTILQNPDAYYGKPVTMSAAVEQVLSKTVFVIDQRKAVGAKDVAAIGKPILVIAPYLTGPLDQKSYLLIRGQIVRFDPAAIARMAADYTLDLAPEIGAKYEGQPVLVATSIINSRYVELGKKPITPPSAEDISLGAAMKTIGPAFAALRTAAQQSKADLVTENAAKLIPAFSRTETTWDDLGQSPATAWTREAGSHAASIGRDAAAGNWEAVKTSAAALNQLCQNCHGTYREQQEDGTFRLKPGSFQAPRATGTAK
jgi:cytochrome c556